MYIRSVAMYINLTLYVGEIYMDNLTGIEITNS